MTITVHGPNNVTIDFPDGTDAATIDGVMRQHFAEASQTGGVGRFADNVVRKIASGATFGYADELAATFDKWLGKGDYESNVASERAKDEHFASEHPLTSFAAETAGAIASPVTKLADAGLAALKAPRYARYFAMGSGLGAASGSGNATEGARGEGAAVGGVAGGALGVAIPGSIEGLSILGKKALNRVMSGPLTPGLRALSSALARDDFSVDEALKRLADLGPDASISDLGPNTQGLARAAAQQPGKALTAAEEFYAARNAGTRERIVQNAFNAAGVKSIDDLVRARSAAAAPLYEAAFAPQTGPATINSKQITSPVLDRLYDDQLVQRGMRAGIDDIMRESRITGIAPKLEDYALARNPETGRLEKAGEPTLRVWDAAKRGLDIILHSGSKDITNPITGRLTQRGMRVEQMRELIVNQLDNLTTDNTGYSAYREARQAWGGPTQVLNALSHLDDVVSNARDGSDLTGRLFGSPAARDKLSALFSSSDEYNAFAKSIQAEKNFFNSSRKVLGNSLTQFTNAAQADMANTSTDALFDLVQKPTLSNVLGQALLATKNYFTSPPTKVSNELAPMLFSSDRASNNAVLDEMTRRLSMGKALSAYGPAGQRLLTGASQIGGYSGGLLGSNQ